MSSSSSSADDEQSDTSQKSTDSPPRSKSKSNRKHPFLNRLIALKNLQLATLEVKAQFFNELCTIESNYEERFKRLCKKRQRIIEGTYITSQTYEKLKASNLLDERGRPKFPCQKIPGFWLAVMLQSPVLKKMIKPNDMPVLQFLNDIKVHYNTDKSFTIEFYFDRNDYFSNGVLRKRYYQVIAVDKDEPFLYDGPEIFRSDGCEIFWKADMNITIEQDSQSNSETDFSNWSDESFNRVNYVDSFFHFFNPPQVPLEKVVVDMELERLLTIDFEIGNFFRKKIIPSAIPIYIKFLKSNKQLAQIVVK